MKLRTLIEAFAPTCTQEIGDRRLMLQAIDQFENVLTRENEILHFTASSWIVDCARTQVLMVYHNLYQSWSWTGGHADGCEDLLAVALREAREETSLSSVEPMMDAPFSLEVLSVPSHVRRGLYVSPHLHLNLTYLLTADSQAPIDCRPEENSAVKWFSLDEAVLASTERPMQAIYRKLNDRLHAL